MVQAGFELGNDVDNVGKELMSYIDSLDKHANTGVHIIFISVLSRNDVCHFMIRYIHF